MSLAVELASTAPVEAALHGLLEGLASCHAVVHRVLAEQLGIALDDVRVRATAPDGIGGDVVLEVGLSGPEPQARYDELRAAVDARGPVIDLVAL